MTIVTNMISHHLVGFFTVTVAVPLDVYADPVFQALWDYVEGQIPLDRANLQVSLHRYAERNLEKK